MDKHPIDIKDEVKAIIDNIIDTISTTANDSPNPEVNNGQVNEMNCSNTQYMDTIGELYKYVNAAQVDINKHTNILIEIWNFV